MKWSDNRASTPTMTEILALALATLIMGLLLVTGMYQT